MSALTEALTQVQANLPHIRKDAKADTGKYTYTYATLTDLSEQLMPLLAKHGLAFTAMPVHLDTGAFVLRFELRHKDGEAIDGSWPLPTSGGPQVQGSAITYARRYALLAVTGVAPDDDDGQAAQQAAKPSTAKPSQLAAAERPPKAGGGPDCALCGKPITGSVVRAGDGWKHKGDCP